jgi:hypothetical protein
MRATATAIRGSAAAANHVFIPVFMKPNQLLVFAGIHMLEVIVNKDSHNSLTTKVKLNF